MALKETWKDKFDGISDILAEDINEIARAVVQLENESGGVGESGATFYPSVSAEGVISWTNDRELPNPTPVNIKGAKGDKGEQGERGIQGEKGVDGKDGVNGKDGTNGKDGEDGQDGFSPIVAVADTEGGHRVTITDKDGEKTFIVMDGKDGQGGVDVSVQSDWEQNDPEAPDYVKNRPFYSYTETTVEEYLLASGTYTSAYIDELGVFASVVPTDNSVSIGAFLFDISLDGTEYKGLVPLNTDIGWFLGNVGILAPLFEAYGLPTPENTGEPFVISVQGSDEYWTDVLLATDLTQSTTHDFSLTYIRKNSKDVVVKIPKEYYDTIGQSYLSQGEIFNNYELNKASGFNSHAEGSYTEASSENSHAEGYGTDAIGGTSHAEGKSTKAIGENSHSEGWGTQAQGFCSHSEGYDTSAVGAYSHAEGDSSGAEGSVAHVEGYGNLARGRCQHVQGEWNVYENKITTERGKYAHIVGNGASDVERSNAHTLDWNGLGWFAGGLKVGGTGQDDENAVDVLTFADMTTIIDAVLNAYPNGDEVSY